MYDDLEDWLRKTFSEQLWICLTTDVWSCKNRSFLAINGHFIDEKALERNSYLLCCTYFTPPHDSDSIAEQFQLIYHKFNIKPPSVVSTVTDNGGNFIKAFRVYGKNNEEFTHFLETYDDGETLGPVEKTDRSRVVSILNSMEENSEPVLDDDEEVDTLLNLLSSAFDENSNEQPAQKDLDNLFQFFESRIDNIEIEDESSSVLSNRSKCNAHTLNLVGAVDSLLAHRNKQYSKKYTAVFEKLNLLWHYSGLQWSSEIMIKYLGSNMNKPSKVRWNWVYDKVYSYNVTTIGF